MYKLPVPSKTELFILALIVSFIAIGFWELGKWIANIVSISISLG